MKKNLVSLFLVFLSIAIAAEPASATILWAGGEDLDFTTNGSAVVENGYNYNPTYTRESVSPSPLTNDTFLKTSVFTNSSTLWVHFYCNFQVQAQANYDWFELADSGGVGRIIVRPTTTVSSGTPTTISINKVNSVGTVTLLATSAGTFYVANTNFSIDLYINYAVAGTMTLYVNGVQAVTFSGDVTTDGQTSLAQLWLGSGDSTWGTDYSEVIVSTTDTRLMHLYSMKPVANGNTMAWTGAVGNINQATYNDSTTISSGTSGQIAEFTVPALPSGNWQIAAVVQSARAIEQAGGPQNLQFDTRTGGTDYQTANQTLTSAFGYYYNIWSTNPNTSVAWTTSDLGAAAFNLGVESQT